MNEPEIKECFSKKIKDIKGYIEKAGITLISLVITIIVLLILAGVTSSTLTGENGLLQKIKEAKNKNENATFEENIALDSYALGIEELLSNSSRGDESAIGNGYFYVPIEKKESAYVSETQTNITISLKDEYKSNMENAKFYKKEDNNFELIYDGDSSECTTIAEIGKEYKFYAIAKYSISPYELAVTETGMPFSQYLIEFWPMNGNLDNTTSSTVGSLSLMGNQEVTYKDGGIALNGEQYIQTNNNYTMPDDFTMMLQVKNVKILANGSSNRFANIIGQGTFSSYNASNGATSSYSGLHWDNYYPVINLISANAGSAYSYHNSELTQDAWKTLTLVNEQNTLKLYLNATQIASFNTDYTQLAEPLSISKPSNTLAYLNGCYRNLIVYSKALTLENITEIISKINR